MRTPEGEMEFASLYEISNALRHGLVGGEDELLVPGQSTWVRVADHSALKVAGPVPRGPPARGASSAASSSGLPSPRRWWR